MDLAERIATRIALSKMNIKKHPTNSAKNNLIKARENSEMSPGEKKVYEYLKTFKLEIIREFHHYSLKNDKTGFHLFIDFYLPEIKVAVEVDGKQHYECNSTFKEDRDKYNDLCRRDEIKNNWCKERGIRMIRIRTAERPDLNKIFDGLLDPKPVEKKTRDMNSIRLRQAVKAEINKKFEDLKVIIDQYPECFVIKEGPNGFSMKMDEQRFRQICKYDESVAKTLKNNLK